VKRYRNIEIILFLSLYAISFSTTFLPPYTAGIAALIVLIGLFPFDSFYCCLPLLIFFYNYLIIPGGFSVYRLFTLMLLVKLLMNGTIKLNLKTSGVFCVYFFYIVTAILPDDCRKGIFLLVDIIVIMLYVNLFLGEGKETLKPFFNHYIYASLLAYPCGILLNNTVSEGNEYTEYIISRYMATFDDPNYMSFFYTIAVFAIVILELFSKRKRIVIVILLYAFIFSTVSVTAIIGNLLFWIIYYLVTRKINFKTLIYIAIITAVLGILYQYGLQSPETPVIGPISYKVDTKISALMHNDIRNATSGRSVVSEENWQFFVNQKSIMKKLFGGNILNCYSIKGFVKVSHNEFIDECINVGIIGAVILISYLLFRTVYYFRRYLKERNREVLLLFMIKCIWIYYAAALTLFLESRFFLFYMI
jgi:hypothetical protein